VAVKKLSPHCDIPFKGFSQAKELVVRTSFVEYCAMKRLPSLHTLQLPYTTGKIDKKKGFAIRKLMFFGHLTKNRAYNWQW
jgi:hypothetical protein